MRRDSEGGQTRPRSLETLTALSSTQGGSGICVETQLYHVAGRVARLVQRARTEAEPSPGPKLCPCHGSGPLNGRCSGSQASVLLLATPPPWDPGTLVRPGASSCFIRPLCPPSPCVLGRPQSTLEDSWAQGPLEVGVGERGPQLGPGQLCPSPQSPLSL